MSLISETGFVYVDRYAYRYKTEDLEAPIVESGTKTSMNKIKPPCDDCPNRLDCQEECRQFTIYCEYGVEVDHPFQ